DEPANPVVLATAAWTSEDGTKVYADFVGPVKTGKLELRSEPAKPKSEILQLLVFGTSDTATAPFSPGSPSSTTGAGGTTSGSAAVAAGAVGGAVAAQGLTAAIDDLTGVQAVATVDTSHADNPRPELEVQVAREVSVRFAHVIGTPPIYQPDTNFASLDWRFS